MLKTVQRAFFLTLAFTLVFGGLYALAVFGIGQGFFSFQANGSLIFHPKSQSIIGSTLIAQKFTSSSWFHPRPSDTEVFGANSEKIELGPSMKLLIDTIQRRGQEYRKMNQLAEEICVPIDAVTTSASGLDPHISIPNAMLQAPRVAQARNLPLDTIHRLIQECTEHPFLGLLGETRINVLLLNLRLDGASGIKE